MKRLLLAAIASVLLVGCPPPGGGRGSSSGGGGGNASAQISPDACGKINTSKAGRKLYAFLVASAELDRASLELEQSIHGACKKMAIELGVSTDGDIRAVCTRAAKELEANLQVSVKTESRLVTKHEPARCTTDIEFTAGVVAECEASVSADVDVRCEGTCGGTCSGVCDGTCSSGGASGSQCNGTCDGACRGRCNGGCDGYANVNASAECKASAEIRASTHTTCTEPKVYVVREDVTVVDDTKFQAALRAIEAGMPRILQATAKLELAGKALGQWVGTGADLVQASGKLLQDMGEQAICVGGQLAAVVAASTQIQARFEVSIEMSASVSASAGASGG